MVDLPTYIRGFASGIRGYSSVNAAAGTHSNLRSEDTALRLLQTPTKCGEHPCCAMGSLINGLGRHAESLDNAFSQLSYFGVIFELSFLLC